MIKQLKQQLVVAAALCALSLVLAGPAAADEPIDPHYTVAACDATGNSSIASGETWGLWPGYGLYAVNDCPHGLQFVANDAAMLDMQSSLWFMPDYTYGVPLTRLSMTVAHGADFGGIEYSVAECDECESVYDIEIPPDSTGEERLEIPLPDLGSVYIRAACRQLSCAGAEGLRVFDIAVQLRDDQPPEGAINLEAPASGWNWYRPGEANFEAAVGDAGAGVVSASIFVDDRTVPQWHQDGICLNLWNPGYSQARVCGGAPYYRAPVDTRGLGNGEHTLTLRASDLLGNAMPPVIQTFGLDGTPPPEPVVTKILETTEFGWSSDRRLELITAVPDEVNGTLDESPLIAPSIDLRPLEPGQVDPPPKLFPYSELIELPADGRWIADIWNTDFAGNRSSVLHVPLNRDRDAPLPPELDLNPWLGLADLLGGYTQKLRPAAPDETHEAGVCGFSFAVDDDPTVQLPAVANLDADALETRLPGGVGEGNHFALARSLGCNGLWSATTSVPLNVDLTPPKPHAYKVPVSPWVKDPVELTFTGSDALSGNAAVFASVDGQPRTQVDGDSMNLTVGEGAHDIAYGAIDVAGNESSPATASVQVDSTPPVAAFDPIQPGTPGNLRATVNDALSGVADAWIEYIAADAAGNATGWTPIITTASREPSGTVRLAARLPDETLADGDYALRVVALDEAGNRGSGRKLQQTGESLLLTTPLRARSTVTAALAAVKSVCFTAAGKRCTKNSKCNSKKSRCTKRLVTDRDAATPRRTVNYGERVALVGQMTGANAQPLANVPLEIFESTLDGPFTFFAATMTDDLGRYELLVKGTSTRRFAVRFAGDSSRAPVQEGATLETRAGLQLKLSKRKIKGGDQLVFSGRLVSGAAHMPTGGKLVTIEFQGADRWVPTGETLWTDLNGRFKLVWTSSKVQSRVAYRFRATAPRESLWPFATGSSRPERLVINQ